MATKTTGSRPKRTYPPRRTPHAARTAVRRSGSQRKRTRRSHSFKLRMRVLAIRLGLICAAALTCYLFYIYVIGPYTSKWQALYGNENYPEGYSIHGIDVSHHQGSIDWEKLSKAQIKDAPVSFVFIKATEGESHIDENFNDNFYESRENGLIRGAYHYFKPQLSAKNQANFFLKQVHLEEGDMPPVLDVEEKGNLTVDQLRKACLVWLRTVEKRYGVPPIIYTNYKFKRDYLNTKDFDRYPYWIAHYYVRSLAYKGKWRFWQHTDCGHIDGIKGKVDLNIYNGSMYDLRHLCIEEQ